MEGKTLVSNSLDIFRLNDLARGVLNAKLGAIKVSDHEVYASKSLQQSNLLFNQ